MEKGDRQGAAQRYRKALVYETQLSETERNDQVVANFKLQPVSKALDTMMKRVREGLDELEGSYLIGTMEEWERSDDVERFPGLSLTYLHPELVPRDLALRYIFERASVIKGTVCDGCKGSARTGKENSGNREGDGIVKNKLKQCGRCRREWYCSSECQKKAWRDGHKQFCRLPFHFKVGDMVQLTPNIVGSKNGHVMEIVGLAEKGKKEDEKCDGDTKWFVAYVGGGDKTQVRGSEMLLVMGIEEVAARARRQLFLM
ncbi:hypothetical protein HDU76_012660 [Blyttiomyces sp. JEL0837]|nr:hypothetical protein HDU76_012660 [Blyttiomyces sp. JEL0837]